MNIKKYLAEKRKLILFHLRKIFKEVLASAPKELKRAMRYAVFSNGKRIRPILAIATYSACGGRKMDEILPFACALELIHNFSLIHDDLPAIDNDEIRRGRATVHKAFGEATAILAGDALFCLAFEVLSQAKVEPSLAIKALQEITNSCGTSGLVGGEFLDCQYNLKDRLKPSFLHAVHTKKTANLFRAAVVVGGIIAKVDNKKLNSLRKIGINIGKIFQIKDDILDSEKKEKLSYVNLFGIEKSQEKLLSLGRRTKRLIAQLGKDFEILANITDFIIGL